MGVDLATLGSGFWLGLGFWAATVAVLIFAIVVSLVTALINGIIDSLKKRKR